MSFVVSVVVHMVEKGGELIETGDVGNGLSFVLCVLVCVCMCVWKEGGGGLEDG